MSKLISARGFTIVELIIVISVISILATIVIVAGSNYINRTNETSLKAKLTTVGGAMKNKYNQDGEYPLSLDDLPSSVDISDVTLYSPPSTTTFCVSGVNNGTTYRVRSTDLTSQVGSCP